MRVDDNGERRDLHTPQMPSVDSVEAGSRSRAGQSIHGSLPRDLRPRRLRFRVALPAEPACVWSLLTGIIVATGPAVRVVARPIPNLTRGSLVEKPI